MEPTTSSQNGVPFGLRPRRAQSARCTMAAIDDEADLGADLEPGAPATVLSDRWTPADDAMMTSRLRVAGHTATPLSSGIAERPRPGVG